MSDIITRHDPVFKTDTLELVPTPKRVRVRFGGATVADSRNATFLYEKGRLPLYYLPKHDVDMSRLQATDHHTHCPRKGDASYWTIAIGDRQAENAVWSYPDPLDGAEPLADYVAFDWHAMDAWFEEDDPVFVHPRDPYHRVDVAASSRHVKAVVGGVTVAESERPMMLFETGLPPRYYLPVTDVRLEHLTPTSTVTRCPYKGNANYYTVKAGGKTLEDVVWTYQTPLPEALRVTGYLCFYSEKLDAFYVDGDKL